MTLGLGTQQRPSQLEDRLAIRDLLEDWVVLRDSGQWDAFGGVWHEDGSMQATWFQGSAKDFIAASRAGMDSGVQILHSLGGSNITIVENRAIAQTKMTISQRAPVHGVECDVVCTGRFYDFLERRDGRWGLVLRQPIYEKDRLDPVSPSATLVLDEGELSRYPAGYRHLAYLQAANGHQVKTDMPGLTGPALAALLERGRRWLHGGAA